MIRLARPSAEEARAQLEAFEREPLAAGLTYSEVGATRGGAAALEAAVGRDYDIDRHVFDLGEGRTVFERASEALYGWRHFAAVPWLATYGMDARACEGQAVASAVRLAGIWFWNPCRVVYELPRDPSSDVAGFAYGTLAGHVERGEERFCVRLDAETGRVEYELLAFSRPGLWLTRLGYPFARRMQRKFAAASAQAMRNSLDRPRR